MLTTTEILDLLSARDRELSEEYRIAQAAFGESGAPAEFEQLEAVMWRLRELHHLRAVVLTRIAASR